MKNIYLIRHGQPDFADGKRICLSRTDLPLNPLGRLQAALLGQYFEENNSALTVFHSGMQRTRQTAEAIDPNTKEIRSMQELGVGDWEGLSFREIRQRWPKLYEERGNAPFTCVMPNGETPVECQQRGLAALRTLAEQTEGDIALVAHAGINRLILCALTGADPDTFLTIPQPYGCVNHLIWDGKTIEVKIVGTVPRPALDEAVCMRLLAAADTPEPVLLHCRAVAAKAIELAEQLDKHHGIDRDKLLAAALLHDIARTERHHPAVAAAWLEALGYPEIASIIACHHDLAEEDENYISEKTLLYLADKYVRGAETVTLAERFDASRKKAPSPEAAAAHSRRYAQAQRVEQLYLQNSTHSAEKKAR